MKVAQIEEAVRALDAAGVRYLIAGGIAVAAHGYGRATFDLDIVVHLEPVNARAAIEALAAIGYRPRVPVTAAQFADRRTRESWIRDKHMQVLNLWSERSRDTPIDIFVTEPFDFESEYRSAFVDEFVPGLPMRFVSLPTLIRMKEAAARPKDLIDLGYLRRLRDDAS